VVPAVVGVEERVARQGLSQARRQGMSRAGIGRVSNRHHAVHARSKKRIRLVAIDLVDLVAELRDGLAGPRLRDRTVGVYCVL
jgi:hypothetical protein